MKVYIVIGNNNESYEDNVTWNDAVFATRETAEQYIKDQPENYYRDMKRIDEIEGKIEYMLDELSEEEQTELETLHNRWYWGWHSCPSYRIEEFEVFG